MSDEKTNEIADAWRQAGHELGFQVVAPFHLQSGLGVTVEYIALVTDFGSEKGMLLLGNSGATEAMRVAEAEGYGFSCLSESYAEFDRELFVDTLND
jgi:hypothetical protein